MESNRSRQLAKIRLCDRAVAEEVHEEHEYPVGVTIRSGKINYRTCPGHRK